MDKKAKIFGTLMALVLALLVLIVAVAVFFPNLFSLGDEIKTSIGDINRDPDGDGIKGISDDCPCSKGDVINKGCPEDFDEVAKKKDRAQYNTDTACGEVPETVGKSTSFKKTADEQVLFHYRSLELFGDAGEDPQISTIRQACGSWVGQIGANCPSEDDDCNEDKFNYQPITNGCWVMASANRDIVKNDCGQAIVANGAIISATTPSSIKEFTDFSTYFSPHNQDPKKLFSWRWRSKSEDGSLLCNKGFWVGCKGSNEQIVEIDRVKYTCKSGEWSKAE